MYCMHCGEQIADNSRYCRYCGKLVAEDEIRTVNEDRAENDRSLEGVEESAEPADGESAAEAAAEEAAEEYNAVNTDEGTQEVIVEDDIFLEHISKGKKRLLFFVAVILTVIVAVIVFTALYPELI